MMRVLLLFLLIVFSQCGLEEIAGISECNNGFFNPRENVGTYESKVIPDMEIALGDTAWFKQSDYWEGNQTCDNSYATFYLEGVLTEFENISIIRSDDYIGVIPRKAGENRIDLLGRIMLRRNGEDFFVYESQSFNVVAKNDANIFFEEPEDLFTPYFEIKDIVAEVTDVGVGDRIELDVQTTPQKTDDDYFSFVILSGKQIDEKTNQPKGYYQTGLSINYKTNIPWDTSTEVMYFTITGTNPKSWDEEKQEFKKNINVRASYSFAIIGSPLNKPFKERTFEIVGLN